MSQMHQLAQHDSPCLWFAAERPVVGRVFVAHRNHHRVLATRLAVPPEGPAMDAEGFVGHTHREFGVLVEREADPDPSWPFDLVREPFKADALVDLSSLTEFQRVVMEATASIPRGQVRTYGDVAREIGLPNAAMAVGQAMKSNRAPLVIPCHRVVGAGKLGGWEYGQDLKRSLLQHEGVHLPSVGASRIGHDRPDVHARPVVTEPPSLEERIKLGESERLEFKSTAGRRGRGLHMQHEVVKTVCGFLNADGGELIVGVKDDGSPIGLDRESPAPDKPFDPDDYERFIRDLLHRCLRPRPRADRLVAIHFEQFRDITVCVVGVKPSPNDPVLGQPLATDGTSWGTRDRDKWNFWVRDGPATRRYEGEASLKNQTYRQVR